MKAQFTSGRIWAFSMLLLTFLFNSIGFAQLLSWPESIVFDSLFDRYLVSNYQSGSIVQVDQSGVQSPFVMNMNATQGLVIVDSVVYVGCDSTVRGFHLATGLQVMNLPVNDVSNLNDITADNEGHLYVSDVFGTKIIKVYPALMSYTVFVNGNGINKPNGIVFDEMNDRLLVCSYRPNFPIQAVSLVDSTVTALYTTQFDYSDGITIDDDGNVYFTSWETLSIYKMKPDFTGSPELIYNNAGGPADICYDEVNNLIAVPLQSINAIDFIPLTTTQINFQDSKIETNLKIFPNPFHTRVKLSFELQKPALVEVIIMDEKGNHVITLIQNKLDPGKYKITWKGRDAQRKKVACGLYNCILQVGDRKYLKLLILR